MDVQNTTKENPQSVKQVEVNHCGEVFLFSDSSFCMCLNADCQPISQCWLIA